VKIGQYLAKGDTIQEYSVSFFDSRCICKLGKRSGSVV